jgi:hypothetical protein
MGDGAKANQQADVGKVFQKLKQSITRQAFNGACRVLIQYG